MAVPRPRAGTPYAIVTRFQPWGEAPCEWPVAYRKSLPRALRECAEGVRAFLQMIGGQWPPLTWLVIDTRDGTRHHPSLSTRGVIDNGESQPSNATLC